MANSAIRTSFIVGVILSLSYAAYAIPGSASFSDPSPLPTACFGSVASNPLAAVSPDIFANSTACGSRYSIRCAGATNNGVTPCRGNSQVTVTVVDLCVACQANQFVLSRETFSMIADTNAGRINIDYTRV